ncbi:MarR family transcriptional regulator [Bosea lathyri]|jgi:DNA-binding MarR family transcriptional regulator|uniref:DNA-binding transcriptional regulator, MarR family n=1 Tax=Bosea lathyri TaxID=1036778 RepID=A0A1H6CML5_9HYPH|nr:MarR family transcriptional regulator [Bosea lathyri]SEG74279.1 DNA-binding transcriptional regulator, MarR family [Bosea lathyri]
MHSKPQYGAHSLGPALNGHNGRAEKRVDSGNGISNGISRHSVTQLDLARLIDRVHRRFLDYLRLELTRLGVDDVSPSQVMVLLNIGTGEIAVRDLLDRGYYLGSNASYNLKQLVESGYLDRGASPRDRRLARISLSTKGQLLCERLKMLDETNQFGPGQDLDLEPEMQTTYDTLRRLEQLWSDALRYGGVLLASCASYSFIVQDLVNSLT